LPSRHTADGAVTAGVAGADQRGGPPCGDQGVPGRSLLVLGVLRVLMGLLFVLILLQPTLAFTRRLEQRPGMLVLVDTSQSMAQTGSGDPLIGNPLLLSMFAAVVVGGTRLGGGRGGPLGSAIGAYVLMIVVNILLVLNVSAYYSTIAEATILILAVLAGSISRDSTLAQQLRGLATRLAARRAGTLVSQLRQDDRRLVVAATGKARAVEEQPSFLTRNAEIRLLRDNVVIFEGKISSLKRFKEDASEVTKGYECGIGIQNFNDVKVGDTIEAFVTEKVMADVGA